MRAAPAIVLSVFLSGCGCRDTPSRSHEGCVKDAIFATQRATEKVLNAHEYADAIAAVGTLKTETEALNQLRGEFSSFPQPSGWDRSRMRRHRSLMESANQKWAAAVVALRQPMEEGRFPPDVRENLDAAIVTFAEAHQQFWSAVEPYWD
jgi:hypothetical protein